MAFPNDVGLAGLDIDDPELLSDADLEVLTDSLGDDQQGLALVFEDVDAAFVAQEA
ncbi:hypothetical protein [Nocardioides endophyticus]|uniref:hypothetical protein n=1 Tax=Nocardioides endophyticus TaxID=1353775 RepID=UPI0031E91534